MASAFAATHMDGFDFFHFHVLDLQILVPPYFCTRIPPDVNPAEDEDNGIDATELREVF